MELSFFELFGNKNASNVTAEEGAPTLEGSCLPLKVNYWPSNVMKLNESYKMDFLAFVVKSLPVRGISRGPTYNAHPLVG